MAKLSQSPILIIVSYTFGLTGIVLGLNAIYNPVFAFTFFEGKYPTGASADPQTRQIIDTLMRVYGVRNVFMGFATLVVTHYRLSKVIGLLTIATGGVALADGAICYSVNGVGQWNHWPLAPIALGLGGVFLGWFDGAWLQRK